MRALKHGLLNLVRKPSKAIMIFSILLVVFSLIFTGIIIQNSINESKIYVRKGLGATVNYLSDYFKAREDDVEDYSQLELSRSAAEEIAAGDDRVKFLSMTNSDSFMSEDLLSGDEDMQEMMEENKAEGWPMECHFYCMGINITTPVEMENGNLTLVDGRVFTQEEIDNNELVVIISQEVAQASEVGVGDVVGVKSWGETGEILNDIEIVGIYAGAEKYMVDNTYMPIGGLEELSPYLKEQGYIQSIAFILYDPMDVDAFIEDNTSKLPNDYQYLDGGNAQYEKLTRPLDLISTIAQIFIGVVFVAGAIIIIAIITIFVRDRKFEIGLLLSSGESKAKIAGQFIFEILIIAVVAFIVSVGLSKVSADYVGNWIVENQLVEDEASRDYSDMYYGYGFGGGVGNVSLENIAEDFDVSISTDIIVNLFFINIGLLLFASGTPLLIILTFKPRQALQD